MSAESLLFSASVVNAEGVGELGHGFAGTNVFGISS